MKIKDQPNTCHLIFTQTDDTSIYSILHPAGLQEARNKKSNYVIGIYYNFGNNVY
jgi:hypothetical protein